MVGCWKRCWGVLSTILLLFVTLKTLMGLIEEPKHLKRVCAIVAALFGGMILTLWIFVVSLEYVHVAGH